VLEKYQGASLEELFNVSQVSLSPARLERESGNIVVRQAPEEDLDLYVDVEVADGQKCERCWRYYDNNGPLHLRRYGPWSNVCGRCAAALKQMGYDEAGAA
jgi:isoleucyl-tRNA synthetase